MLSTNSENPVEHFVTLFDNNFLPVGLCLHASLLKQSSSFHLWIVCMDELVAQNLQKLSLPHVSLIPVNEVEDSRLLAVKSTRSRGEYCWTLTSFTPQFVFERQPDVQRVTYLDADLFFFANPKLLLDEFENSGKHVLITEHAYDPRYQRFGRAERSGRFCVQFMTFRQTPESAKVMHWWQDRCLEWCYARAEDGKFGDQKYLDQWPVLFAEEIHILEQMHKTLAPWNVRYFAEQGQGSVSPVFYHFHGLRIISPTQVQLYSGYQVGKAAEFIYQTFLASLLENIAIMRSNTIPLPCLPLRKDFLGRCLALKRKFWDGEAFANIPSVESAL